MQNSNPNKGKVLVGGVYIVPSAAMEAVAEITSPAFEKSITPLIRQIRDKRLDALLKAVEIGDHSSAGVLRGEVKMADFLTDELKKFLVRGLEGLRQKGKADPKSSA